MHIYNPLASLEIFVAYFSTIKLFVYLLVNTFSISFYVYLSDAVV